MRTALFVFGILWATTVRASLEQQRSFYTEHLRFVEAKMPELTAEQRHRIADLAKDDIRGYADIVFNAWFDQVSYEERAKMKSAHDQVGAVDAQGDFLSHAGDALRDFWGQIHILLPARMHRDSIYYYFLEFHEQEHVRQQILFYESTDAYPDEVYGDELFWFRFEVERAAMTMEWFFLHNLPGWGQSAFLKEIASLPIQNSYTRMAEISARHADHSLEDYLETQWASGRYSWEKLREHCAKIIAKDVASSVE